MPKRSLVADLEALLAAVPGSQQAEKLKARFIKKLERLEVLARQADDGIAKSSAKGDANRQAVIEALAACKKKGLPPTPKNIELHCDVAYSTVRRHLKDLRDEHKLIWGLPPPGFDPDAD